MAENKNQETIESKGKQINLDYFGILKRAFGMVRYHRYLWYLGIFAGGSFTSFNYSGNFNGFFNQNKGNSASAASTVNTIDSSRVWEEIVKWLQANWVLVLVIGIIVLVLVIIFTLLSIMAKAGLIHAVDQLSKNKESSFMQAMRFGWHKFWRVFGACLLVALAVTVALTVLVLPAILLWFIKPLFILYVLFMIFVAIFVSIIVGIVFEYTLRYITLKNRGVVASIKDGVGLLKSLKKETALVWLVTVGIAIACGVVLALAMILILLVLFLIGLVFYIFAPVAAIIYGIIVGVAFIVGIFIASGFVSSFVSTYWTLCFKELTA